LAAAEEEMSFWRKAMHSSRSSVWNLTKLSRPPDGMREVDERRRRCFWKGGYPALAASSRVEAGRDWRVVEEGEREWEPPSRAWLSDLGPRIPFGTAGRSGGEGVLGDLSGEDGNRRGEVEVEGWG